MHCIWIYILCYCLCVAGESSQTLVNNQYSFGNAEVVNGSPGTLQQPVRATNLEFGSFWRPLLLLLSTSLSGGRDHCKLNNMSAVDEETAETILCCASCGKAAVDDVKLKICTACKLVKYCSVECQKNHRPQHKKACKKRAAEIKDDRLFTQPDESYLG